MTDDGASTEVTWPDLLAHPAVWEESVLGAPIGLMAFHGGLETGTAEIARRAAALSGASLYVVEQPAELRWHVPSRSVDPHHSPQLRDWLDHVEVAVALHGYGRVRQPRRVLIGGTNRALAGRLAVVLGARLPELQVVADLDDIPRELRGLHPANPVNRPSGRGVQVELPPSARDPRLDRHLPGRVGEALAELVRGYLDATTLP
ncbi:MAG: poly-gamma-glutamate hydrolase family protein [Actinomycetota bacterium]|nr:poly-gamma-glutamate hydrolase family protein [Actinomycetota bacterium]